MDRNSIIGFVLIGIILLGWLYFQNKNSDQKQKETHKTEQQQTKQQAPDTTKKTPPVDTTKKQVVKDTVQENLAVNEKYGSIFSKFEKGEDKVIMIETDKFYAEFSTKGGALIKYEVKGFKTWD